MKNVFKVYQINKIYIQNCYRKLKPEINFKTFGAIFKI